VSNRRILDTNVIVRYLVQDSREQAKVAEKLFDACDRGQVVLVLLPAVLAECVFVLQSFYRRTRRDIASTLRRLATSPGIEIDGAAVFVDALERYEKTSCHFVDCVIAATAAAEGVLVATFDEGYRQFPDVRVAIAPG